MHIPSSLLTSLLGLVALTPSISANPVAQATNELIDPIPTPDFSRCNFIQIIRSTIEGPFTLTAISDALPIQSWPVQLRSPSAKTAQSPYISRTRIAQPQFTLIGGSLNATGVGANGGPASFPGRFESSYSSVLERFLFGGKASATGSEEPVGFYSIQNCDALGRPYVELKAGRELLVKDFKEGATIFGKDSQDEYPGKYTQIHLQINQVLTV